MNKITGIVLCGGKSCRFGKDKGLCTLAGKLMISYPLEAMESLCDEILISTNDVRYSDLGYKLIPDIIKNTGPLGGLYSALKHSSNENNLIVSCDMPFVSRQLLQYIFENRGDAMVASAFAKGYIEPLCSYFHKDTLHPIEQMLRAEDYKLTHLFDNVNFKKIIIDDKLDFYRDYLFLNVNTGVEYELASEILSKINKNFKN